MLPGDFFCLLFPRTFLSSRRFGFRAKEINLCDYCGRAEEEGTSSIGSLDQYGDLCGYVHNFCDLWEGDILLTSFTSSRAGGEADYLLTLGGVNAQQCQRYSIDATTPWPYQISLRQQTVAASGYYIRKGSCDCDFAYRWPWSLASAARGVFSIASA